MKRIFSARIKKELTLVLVLSFIVTAVFPLASPTATNAVTLPEVVGMNISSFSSETMDGLPVNGSIFEENVITVLHYFATWSADCIRELRYMQRASEDYSGSVKVYGILHQDGTSTAQEAMRLFAEYGIEYQCILPDEVLTELITRYNFIPQTFFVSSAGVVLEHFPGTFTSYDSVSLRIENLLNSAIEPVYTIEFLDGLTGLFISSQTVTEGSDAVPPVPPVHPGHDFDGWEGEYSHVSASGVVLAMYRATGDTAPLLGDVNVDGRITILDALLTARSALNLFESPSVELYGDVDGDGSIGLRDALIITRAALHLIPQPVLDPIV